MSEQQLLRDPGVEPSDEIIAEGLGAALIVIGAIIIKGRKRFKRGNSDFG
jgi:hypothetical protein